MGGSKETITHKNSNEGQCQFFVVRKKRLCRMTVRPGHIWCGEHEPRPPLELAQTDKRIPCPYDPKHTCYTSKLEKHLSICNARPEQLPPYIVTDINVPADVEPQIRRPLTEIPKGTLLRVLEKINRLYAEHVEGNISSLPEQEIHSVVIPEFSDSLRAETSRRHLRQASALLHLVEAKGLVRDRTCYVELGAGKGQLSYYVSNAWCGGGCDSGLVLVDRAALRHKRDGKMAGRSARVRADLRHLALHTLQELQRYDAVVGLAKHLCGVATDYALRCMTQVSGTRGVVMATCCHHRCERQAYVGTPFLQELGVSGEELNIMLSVVSWATCGDGRARTTRRLPNETKSLSQPDARKENCMDSPLSFQASSENELISPSSHHDASDNSDNSVVSPLSNHDDFRQQFCRDTKKVFILKDNLKAIKIKDSNLSDSKDQNKVLDSNQKNSSSKDIKERPAKDLCSDSKNREKEILVEHEQGLDKKVNDNYERHKSHEEILQTKDEATNLTLDLIDNTNPSSEISMLKEELKGPEVLNQKELLNDGESKLNLSLAEREAVGRRAKALVDWGRVLFLRSKGMDAHLYYYVPTSVSLENMCIVATRTI